jgi:hypothetical protein
MSHDWSCSIQDLKLWIQSSSNIKTIVFTNKSISDISLTHPNKVYFKDLLFLFSPWKSSIVSLKKCYISDGRHRIRIKYCVLQDDNWAALYGRWSWLLMNLLSLLDIVIITLKIVPLSSIYLDKINLNRRFFC